MNLSFFTKESFLRENKEENSGLYLQRVSSVVRAKEIAKFLSAKYNPKLGYEDVDNNYIHARSFDELIKEVEKLKDQKYYNVWTQKILPIAESYHIDEIAKLYRALK